MLLVDDLLTAPMKGILWVFQEIHKAATEEQRARREQIMADLSALYVSLEQGEITDAVFDDREQALLDELDALDAREDAEGTDDEDEDDDEDETDLESGSTVTVANAYPELRNALIDAPAPTEPRKATPAAQPARKPATTKRTTKKDLVS